MNPSVDGGRCAVVPTGTLRPPTPVKLPETDDKDVVLKLVLNVPMPPVILPTPDEPTIRPFLTLKSERTGM